MPSARIYVKSNDGNIQYADMYWDAFYGESVKVTNKGLYYDNPPVPIVSTDNGATYSSTNGNLILPLTIKGFATEANAIEPTYSVDTLISLAIGTTTIYAVPDSTPQPTLTFKHFYDAGTIGSGTVKFRHYSQTEPLPQLATPQNVTANGTTVSWDEVENTTSYAVLADGNEIGTVENPGGYTVTFICQKGMVGFKYSIDNMSADLRIKNGETKNIIVTEFLFIKAYGVTPEVVSYSGGTLETTASIGEWIFTPTQNNATITVVDYD